MSESFVDLTYTYDGDKIVWVKPSQVIAVDAPMKSTNSLSYRVFYLHGGQYVVADDTPENMVKVGVR